MKPAQEPHAAPETPVRVEFQVQFSSGPKDRRQAPTTAPKAFPVQESSDSTVNIQAPELVKEPSPSRVPKITRLLVLGHHFENLVRDGVVKDYAEIARLTGLSRARVTQIVNLTLMAPRIQEALLTLPGTSYHSNRKSERQLRLLVTRWDWSHQ